MGLSLLFCTCGREGQQLFELLTPQRSGITFTNSLSESDSLNILNYVYYYNGGGVGIADFNNDGLEDIFFSGNETTCRMYLNKGKMVFEDVTEQVGVQTTQWCTGVAIADINSDGWMDIYVCAAGYAEPARRKNLLFINQGLLNAEKKELHFVESAAEYGLADTAYSTQAAFLDYDCDGDLDLYVMNHANERESVNTPLPKKLNGEGSSNDRLYQNNGNRSFSDVTRSAGILTEGYGLGIAVTDINQDGWPDIYIANDFIYNDVLYLNEGGKKFSNQIGQFFKHQTYNSMGCDFADFNNDLRPDLMVVDMLPETDYNQKMMAGAMTWDKSQLIQLAGYEPQYVRNTLQLAPSPVNSGSSWAVDRRPSSVDRRPWAVLRGSSSVGRLPWAEIAQLSGVSATDWSWAPLFADFDNDGLKDLFISNGYLRDITDKDFIHYSKNLSMFKSPGEADRQLLPKIRELKGKRLPNRVFQNKGDLTFLPRSKDWGLTQASCSNGVAYADLDADGDLDLVVNNLNEPAFVYENKANKLFKNNYLDIKLEGDSSNKTGVGATVVVRSSGKAQYLEQYHSRGFMSSVTPVLHVGLGNATSIDTLLVRWSDGRQQLIEGLAANQTIILRQENAATPSQHSPAISMLLFTLVDEATSGLVFLHCAPVFNDFQYQPLLPHGFSENGPPLAVGDLNGDGLDDCFVGGAMGQAGKLFFQQPDGRFQGKDLSEGMEAEDTDAVIFDANNDGFQDLYVVSGSNKWPPNSQFYQDRLYMNDGHGVLRWNKNALPTKQSPANCVATADFDRDGDLDLFIGGGAAPRNYPMPARSYLLRNDHGTFTDLTENIELDGKLNNDALKFPGIVNAAQWADIDQDGMPDLLMLGEWMPLTVFKNTGSGFVDATGKLGLATSTGWWTALEINDLDADGDLDFVAGNLGLNSRYKASEQHQLTLYAHDFDNNSSLDAVLCRFMEGKEKPAHQRDELLAQINGLSTKYSSYAKYAAASVQDIFGDELLSKAYFRNCKHLESAVFVNNQGQYVLKPLPLEAQMAPVNAIFCADFNQDGFTDILMVGNTYAANVAAGHYDASSGWLLMGAGDGRFYPMSAASSGFIVEGVGKSLSSLTLKSGAKRILVGANNALVKAFDLENTTTPASNTHPSFNTDQ